MYFSASSSCVCEGVRERGCGFARYSILVLWLLKGFHYMRGATWIQWLHMESKEVSDTLQLLLFDSMVSLLLCVCMWMITYS